MASSFSEREAMKELGSSERGFLMPTRHSVPSGFLPYARISPETDTSAADIP